MSALLSTLITPLAFLFTLGLLVTIHEYGHFQVAKWCGVKVLKFSIGFGNPLFSKKLGKDQTEFVIAAIPLGGYVKMLDESDMTDETQQHSEKDLQRALNRQSIGKRMAIVLAGSGANLLLAIVLYWALLMMGVIGMRPVIGNVVDNSPAARASLTSGELIQKINGEAVTTWQDARWLLLNASLKNKVIEIQAINNRQEVHVHQVDLSASSHREDSRNGKDIDVLQQLGVAVFQPKITARLGEIIENSPAAFAGLKSDDLILKVNNSKVNAWDDFVKVIRSNPNKKVTLLIERNKVNLTLSMTPEAVTENNQTVGRVGASFRVVQAELDKIFITTHHTPISALTGAVKKTWDTAVFSLKMLGNMLTGQVSWKSISGPVTIASYAGQSANMGVKVFIGFLALISISIGVLNLLPIPVLDGGHFMYYMFEFFTGKPVTENVMILGQKIGFALLGLMMLLALYNDINRLITG